MDSVQTYRRDAPILPVTQRHTSKTTVDNQATFKERESTWCVRACAMMTHAHTRTDGNLLLILIGAMLASKRL